MTQQPISGQSNAHFTLVNYDSRVIIYFTVVYLLIGKIPYILYSAYKEISLLIVAVEKVICPHNQCDQIRRFIGLWATF